MMAEFSQIQECTTFVVYNNLIRQDNDYYGGIKITRAALQHGQRCLTAVLFIRGISAVDDLVAPGGYWYASSILTG